jgi:hypothetical protein
MRISNCLALAALCCASGLSADEVTLAGSASRLTGTVRAIDEAGLIELSSTLSPGPVFLKGEAVDKVTFGIAGAAARPPTAEIELTNGDRLPAEIESLDDEKLSILSPDAGRLEIPRAALASMHVGVQRRKVVYAGPKALDEWTGLDGELKNWTYEQGKLIASGTGNAVRKLKLPEQFILRFTLSWQQKTVPNFKIHFADPLKPLGEAADRYFLQFAGAGMEIKRESSKGKRYNTLVQLNRTPNQYPDQQLQVEIRVNRKTARLRLFLNGEPEGEFADPIPDLPTGSAIVLSCITQNGTSQEISGIEVLELDDSHRRHRAEDRGDPKNDSLINRDDERSGGKLLEIRTTDQGRVFRFKSDFQNDPLEVPETEVSTVFFAAKEAKATAADPSFMLRLRGDGLLGVTSCRISEQSLVAEHPLLGKLEFRREGVVSLERTKPKTKAAPGP